MRKEHQTLEREKMEVLRDQQMQMLQQHAESHAAATATKPTAVTQLSDDDAAATAAVKSFDGVIAKITNKLLLFTKKHFQMQLLLCLLNLELCLT